MVSDYADIYRKAVVYLFRRYQNKSMRKDYVLKDMAFTLDWFIPEDGDKFLDFCKAEGLITIHYGKVEPTFDLDSIDVPYDWDLSLALGIKRASEIWLDKAAYAKLQRERREFEASEREEKRKRLAAMRIEEPGERKFERGDSGSIRYYNTESDRDDVRASTVARIMRSGLSELAAQGLFDYHELNFGLYDYDMFYEVARNREKIQHDVMIEKAYRALQEVDPLKY